MEAQYHHFDNEDQLRAIRTHVESLMPLIPSWVREVNVYSVYELGDGLLACRLDPEYRFASIDVPPAFFDRSLETQRRRLLHEFIHTLLGEFHPWVEDRLLEPLKEKNADLYKALHAEFTERLERVVQEFTYLLEPLLSK